LDTTDVTEAEIKKAYRKLALKYHPDKHRGRESNAMATNKMAEINAANDVLSTPWKKEAYDMFGEEGLTMYEQYMKASGADDMDDMPASPLQMLATACMTVSCFITLITIFAALVVTNVDRTNAGTPTISWTYVFLPLLFFDAILFCVTCTGWMSEADKGGLSSAVFFESLCFIGFQLTLITRLNDAASMTWAQVFAPAFVLLALDAVSTLKQCMQASYENAKNAGLTADGYCGYVVRKVLGMCFRIALVALLVAKLDTTIVISWGVLFLPLWLNLGFDLLTAMGALICADIPDDEAGGNLRKVLKARIVGSVLVTILVLLLVLKVRPPACRFCSSACQEHACRVCARARACVCMDAVTKEVTKECSLLVLFCHRSTRPPSYLLARCSWTASRPTPPPSSPCRSSSFPESSSAAAAACAAWRVPRGDRRVPVARAARAAQRVEVGSARTTRRRR
jgi:curved DNA-binding protein CbpA